MPDMLVKLYNLNQADISIAQASLQKEGIGLQPAMAPNLTLIREWIQTNFSAGWADEATKGILSDTPRCFLAVKDGKICGFACYDCTTRGFFGPTGVLPEFRGKGIGKALLLHTLVAMGTAGYAYAVIGGVGPADFYSSSCGAEIIRDSEPGYYRFLL